MMGGIMQVFISKDDRQCAGPEYFLWRAGGGHGGVDRIAGAASGGGGGLQF